MKTELLGNDALERSSVVANSLMNRTRAARGGNSYEKELAFAIIDFLKARLARETRIRWLDLCCGSGKALIEAADLFARQNPNPPEIKITGVDLAGMFAPYSPDLNFLHLVESPIERFQPDAEFDLITCVHGLHYIGDKLAVIRKAAAWLKKDGIFAANLDLANFKHADNKPAARTIAKELTKHGIEYKSNKHLILCRGKKHLDFNLKYLGADDQAGANYTGQPAVNSYYAKLA